MDDEAWAMCYSGSGRLMPAGSRLEPKVLTAAAALYAALVFGFSASARWLGRVFVGAPIAFLAAGVVISAVTSTPPPEMAGGVKALTEVTLVLILFHDAAQVRPTQISANRGVIIRLLLVGLPLTVVFGFLTAVVVFPTLPAMLGLLLAAALAPTDAGLGAATVSNPVVPVRIRRTLNVESGVNDGMITPVVLFAIAAVEGTEGLRAGVSLAHAVLDLVIGIAVGALIGAGGGRLLGWSRERGTSTVATRSLGVLALPILAYCVVLLLDGNGFVAAFVAGTAFTATAHWIDDDDASALVLTEALSQLLGFAVWLMFGLVAVPVVRDHVGWRELTFGVLSLTVLRMLPVAVALLGSGLTGRSVLFLGWFGPRGLASLVFALLAIEDLDRDGPLRTVTATITVTVLLSVVLHGVTADPLARRYGRWVERVRPPAELSPSTEPRPRRTWEHRHHGG